MGKYFGTDGFRGEANVNLTVEHAYKVGRYLGWYYSQNHTARVVIGKDTRRSSYMFEYALVSGLTASGADVYLLHVTTTPSVSYVVRSEEFDCGIMISASHNPYYDNGIKVISSEGLKLDSATESQIEDFIDGLYTIPLKNDTEIGCIKNYAEGLNHYMDWLVGLFDVDFKGLRLALDCANGSAVTTAQRVLERLGADCTVIHHSPNGLNINTHCGSTHPEELQTLMKNGQFDLGLAFDGDADRLIAVDPNGNQINGDYILYICGKYLKQQGHLVKNTVVTTVMANLGFFKAMQANEIDTASTQVGDKYVFECMCKEGYVLGGEQSGHIIFKEHATTGDGLLTACKLLEIMKKTNKSILELSEGLKIYPQLLVNVKVKDKEETLKDQRILDEIAKVEKELHGNGRVLVRPSGTEPLVRVMAEAETDEICHECVYRIVNLINQD